MSAYFLATPGLFFNHKEQRQTPEPQFLSLIRYSLKLVRKMLVLHPRGRIYV